MRLIDADAFIAKLNHVPMVQEAIRKAMDTMPTIEERKTGTWNTIQSDIVVCSLCGMSAPQVTTGCLMNRHLEQIRTNFCPNCGADMRGEGHE